MGMGGAKTKIPGKNVEITVFVLAMLRSLLLLILEIVRRFLVGVDD